MARLLVGVGNDQEFWTHSAYQFSSPCQKNKKFLWELDSFYDHKPSKKVSFSGRFFAEKNVKKEKNKDYILNPHLSDF